MIRLKYESSVSSRSFPMPPPLPLIDIFSNNILNILFLLLRRQGRWITIKNMSPLLQLFLLLRCLPRQIFGVVTTRRAQNVFLEQNLRITLASRWDTVFFARRLMPNSTDIMSLQILRDTVSWKIKRLFGNRNLSSRLLLRLRRSYLNLILRAWLFIDYLYIRGQVYQFSKSGRNFRLKILALLHAGEVMLQIDQNWVELCLVGLLPHVKFDYSALKDRD